MTDFHEGADPAHGGLSRHVGTREDCPSPSCRRDDALERLDSLNWDRIAHLASVEAGVDVTAEQARLLAGREIARQFGEAP